MTATPNSTLPAIELDVSDAPMVHVRVRKHLAVQDMQPFFTSLQSFLERGQSYVAQVMFDEGAPMLSAFLRRDIIRDMLRMSPLFDRCCLGTVIVLPNGYARKALHSVLWAVRLRHPVLLTCNPAEADSFAHTQLANAAPGALRAVG